jgi:hypothetical protein
LADRDPYRGGPKGRVKWETVNLGNFFRDKAIIVGVPSRQWSWHLIFGDGALHE